MERTRTALLSLVALPLLTGCATDSIRAEQPPASAPAQGDTGAAPALASLGANPVRRAEAVLGSEFAGTPLIGEVVSVVFVDGLLQVTLDRATVTLGGADGYNRMCNALRSLIEPEGAPGRIAGVQLFRADGSAVVASGSPDQPCGRFYR